MNWAKSQSSPIGRPDGRSHHEHLWDWLKTQTQVVDFYVRGYHEAHTARVDADYYLVSSPAHPFDLDTFEDGWGLITGLHELVEALPPLLPDLGPDRQAEAERLRERARQIWAP